MITKVTTVNSAIQMLKTAVDLTDVIPLEEDTVLTKRHIFLTQNVSKIFSSDTLTVRSLTIDMLNLTSKRCSQTIFRTHTMFNPSPKLHQFTTQFIMDQSTSHAVARDMGEKERQGTQLLDMFAHTVTSNRIDATLADMQETQRKAVYQVNLQKMRSIMHTNALSSSKRRIKDVRSHFPCGEAMVRRRDAVTVSSVRNSGILSALPASLSLTATFAPLCARMEPLTTKDSASSKDTTSSKSATQTRNSSMVSATENVQEIHQNFRFFASVSAQVIWSNVATLFVSNKISSAPLTSLRRRSTSTSWSPSTSL